MPRRNRPDLRTCLSVAALTLVSCQTADAQALKRPTNLQVLPRDIEMRALIDTMRGFTRALGVRCTYCHVGEEGKELATYDFASDQKPGKEKAREMLRMVTQINGQQLANLSSRRDPPIAVTCATCHRGVAEPRPLQQLLLAAYEEAGADSAEALYRALRKRYYGRAAYDFGEVPLVDVGSALQAKGRLADAVRFYLVNVEFLPESRFALRQAADALVAVGDTAGATRHLQRALVLDPQDQQARSALDLLRK